MVVKYCIGGSYIYKYCMNNNKALKKVPANKENFRFDYEYNAENMKFRFMRISKTNVGDNYKIINYNETAKYDHEYYNVLGTSKNLKEAKFIANQFAISESINQQKGN